MFVGATVLADLGVSWSAIPRSLGRVQKQFLFNAAEQRIRGQAHVCGPRSHLSLMISPTMMTSLYCATTRLLQPALLLQLSSLMQDYRWDENSEETDEHQNENIVRTMNSLRSWPPILSLADTIQTATSKSCRPADNRSQNFLQTPVGGDTMI
jgi:hypothetical protein